MSTRYALISLVALFVIFLLILKNVETWTRPMETAPERTSPKKQEAKSESPPAPRPQTIEGSAQPYVAIAGKNIFSPDRKDFPVQASEMKSIVRPQVTLYGVTIGDGFQFASIVNPGRRLLKGERETLSVKVGDKVGDYKLAKISSDRITLEAEGDAFEVLLYDPKSPKRRSDVRTTVSPPPAPAAPSGTSQAQPIQQPAPPRVASPPVAAAPTPQLPAYDYRRSRRPVMVPSQAAPSPATPLAGTPAGATPPPAAGQPQGAGGN